MTGTVYGEVVVVRTDGDVSVQLLDTSTRVLDQLYTWTGAHNVDVVGLAQDLDMWVDDDGMYGRPANMVATYIARQHGMTHQPYFGTAVFARADDEGDTVGLTPERVEDLLGEARTAIALFNFAPQSDPTPGSDTSRKESL